jgi:hypothetical protein
MEITNEEMKEALKNEVMTVRIKKLMMENSLSKVPGLKLANPNAASEIEMQAIGLKKAIEEMTEVETILNEEYDKLGGSIIQ